MVVPLATSNSFAPLADDDDRTSSSRPAASAMGPRSTPEERKVTWAEVMADLSAQRTVDDSLAWTLALRINGHLLITMPRPRLETHLLIPASV